MKISLVGGTGSCGNGFAVRWAEKHEIIIGSRNPEKAALGADKIRKYLNDNGIEANIRGTYNQSAITEGDVIVLAIPPRFIRSVTKDLYNCYTDQIVVSPIVPMGRSDYFDYRPPVEGCAALMVASLLPPTVKLVTAFHTVSYASLQQINKILKGDVIICGDNDDAKTVVSDLVREIKCLRPLDGGPLSASYQVEALTPLLLNIARLNDMSNVGIQIVEEY